MKVILDIHINNDVHININVDINMNIDLPPTPTPVPRLRTAPAWGGCVWGDINIHIDINMNIDIHIIINMNRPQSPLRRPAGLLFFLFCHAFLKKGPFLSMLTLCCQRLCNVGQ